MARKHSALPRRIRKFKYVDPEDRFNPASIRRFLFDMIWQEFERSCTRTANSLSESLRNARHPRQHRRRYISGEATYKVTRDSQTISYNLLDGMALHYGIPIALILLFTRVRSEVNSSEGHTKHSALRVLRAFQAAMDALYKITDATPAPLADVNPYLDHEKFLEVRRAFLAVLEDEEPSFFD